MKRKQALKNLLFVGFTLVLAGGFASSCGDDDNGYYDDGKSGNNPHPTNKLLVSEVITSEVTFKYTYDDQNRLVRTVSLPEWGVNIAHDTVYTNYDQQGRIVSEVDMYKRTTTYNHISDRQIEEITEAMEDYDKNPKRIFYLDNKGQLEKIHCENGGKYFPDDEETFKYDARGNMIERKLTDLAEDYPMTWTFEYTYDNHYSPYSQIAKYPKWFSVAVSEERSFVNNCLTKKIGNETTNYSYTYNSDGYPIRMEYGAEKVTYKYIPAK